MLLIDPQGNYPRYVGDLRSQNPGWEEGQALPEGWINVNYSSVPEFDMSTQRLEELSPSLAEDGQYYQTWNVREATAEELEVANAPSTARIKFQNLGFTDPEIDFILQGFK